jgi:hypothetical protein
MAKHKLIDNKKKHQAVDDAIEQGQMFMRMREDNGHPRRL